MLQSSSLYGRRMRSRLSRFIREEVRYTSEDLEKEYQESKSRSKNEDFFRIFIKHCELMRPFTPTLRLIYHDLLTKDQKITKINYFDLAEGFSRFSFLDFQLMTQLENKLKERNYFNRGEFIKLLAFLNTFFITSTSISLKMTELFDFIYKDEGSIWRERDIKQEFDEEELRKANELKMLEEVRKKKEAEEQLRIKEEQDQVFLEDEFLFRMRGKDGRRKEKGASEERKKREEESLNKQEDHNRMEEENFRSDEQEEEVHLMLDQLRIQSVIGKKNPLGLKLMGFLKKWCDELEPKGESLGKLVRAWNKVEDIIEIDVSFVRCLLGKIDFLMVWAITNQSEEGFDWECWLRDGWQILIRLEKRVVEDYSFYFIFKGKEGNGRNGRRGEWRLET